MLTKNLAELYENRKEDEVTDFCSHTHWINCNSLPWCKVYNKPCNPKYWKSCNIYQDYLNKKYMEG